MYDMVRTKQSLPSEMYRLLLGTALSVFSSNNGFIIENILHTDSSYSWYELIDKESGRLMKHIEKTIANSNPAIAKKFGEIVEMRNRIIHGFRVTSPDGEQFIITEKYLIDFIKKNDELYDMLHNYRGY